ncbi:MAG: DEAD/DEAH box helicase family protein, partial [Alphaproteobacteria bacterium]|nr:DEAD/DEAH box helicase family protein [Alphaproteobacteria bacterium]
MQRNTPISYLRTISSCPETKTIEEILSIIKNGSFELYNGMSLKDSIEEIRASNKGRRKKLKKGLPYFIPTVLLFDENILREDSIISGAVQFDVDLKDNEKINFDELKNDIIKIPEVIYAFTSPSGGLKFAIKTDFQKNKNDDAETLKAKYKQAYEVCKEYVSSFVNIKYDDSMKALKFPCFLSYDKEAYFNPACLVLEVNSDCIYEKPEEFNLSYDTNITTEQVEELLSYIPKDFDYDERLPINYAVFSSIGKAGVSILFNHWITDDRTKLKKDLISQSEEKKPLANLGFLIKTAVEYGYKVTTGTKRRYLEPKNSSHKFQPLLTTNEAKDKLEEIVNNFFQSKKSVFINISTGTGKTEEVLKILRNIPSNKNVLYLVESHELAEEIKERFYKIEVKNKLGINSSIVHIKGRNKTCERSDIADKYNKANMSIPSLQCEEGCPHKCKCNYSFQFAKKANIRLMTHNEFMNEKSIWSSGYDPLTNSPKKKGWKADYIIIDEDYFQFQNYHEKLDNEYDGIRNIINHIANKTLGKSKAIGSAEFFLEAVKEHESDILADFQRMNSNKPNKITFKNTDDYIRQTKKQSGKRQSEILKLLNLYVLTSDKKFLNSIWFENNKLKHSRLKSVADHYKDIPTF